MGSREGMEPEERRASKAPEPGGAEGPAVPEPERETPPPGAAGPAPDAGSGGPYAVVDSPVGDVPPGEAPPPDPEPEPDPRLAPEPEVRGAGDGALSLPARGIVALGLAVVALAVAVHLAMVFLHVAPSNTVTKQYGKEVNDYVYPEFEQDWKLFAPNPLQQNIAVQVRAKATGDDGRTRTTGWTDLTARDGAAIRHNPAPSHTQQNELRRGWEFFSGSHDAKGRPVGLRGDLSERYIKRIVMRRIGTEADGGTVQQIQVRSATTPVRPPPWSGESTNGKARYQVQPWWQVTGADLPKGGGK